MLNDSALTCGCDTLTCVRVTGTGARARFSTIRVWLHTVHVSDLTYFNQYLHGGLLFVSNLQCLCLVVKAVTLIKERTSINVCGMKKLADKPYLLYFDVVECAASMGKVSYIHIFNVILIAYVLVTQIIYLEQVNDLSYR